MYQCLQLKLKKKKKKRTHSTRYLKLSPLISSLSGMVPPPVNPRTRHAHIIYASALWLIRRGSACLLKEYNDSTLKTIIIAAVYDKSHPFPYPHLKMHSCDDLQNSFSSTSAWLDMMHLSLLSRQMYVEHSTWGSHKERAIFVSLLDLRGLDYASGRHRWPSLESLICGL